MAPCQGRYFYSPKPLCKIVRLVLIESACLQSRLLSVCLSLNLAISYHSVRYITSDFMQIILVCEICNINRLFIAYAIVKYALCIIELLTDHMIKCYCYVLLFLHQKRMYIYNAKRGLINGI